MTQYKELKVTLDAATPTASEEIVMGSHLRDSLSAL